MKKAKKSPRVVGVDLGGTNVRAGLVGDGRILKLTAQTVRSQGAASEVFEDLCSAIDSVMEPGVKGLGLGVPCLVQVKTGVVVRATNIPSWHNIPLRKLLEKRYRIPVQINNDANCFALGERYFGFGRRFHNFVGAVVGTGLGAGIVVHGRLHSGADCGAGEFGLIPYRDGIVENYASGQFFHRFNWDGATLFHEATQGNPKALEIFQAYGTELAHAIQLMLYAVAPEMIVLGGSVSHSFPYFKESLFEGLKSFAYPSIVEKLQFKVSKVKDIAVLGAAALLEEPRLS